MKKINLNRLAVFTSLLTVFASCEQVDDLEGVTRGDKSMFSVDQTTASVTEGDEITFTVTIDKPLSENIDYKIELVGGTGTFRDYTASGHENDISEGGYAQGTIGHTLVFPAYATTSTFTITPVKDLLVEGNETLEIWLRSSGNGLALVDDASSMITINVADYVSNDLGIKLDWSQPETDIHGTIENGTYLDSNEEVALFTGWDFDLYLFNSSFVDVSNNAAATGAVPEVAEVLNTDLPDGSYFVFIDLYEAGEAPLNEFEHEVNLTVSKYGVWSTTVQVPVSSDDTAFSGIALTIQKTGTTYTVLDYDTGNTIISGRNSNLSTIREMVQSKLRKR